MNGREPVSQCLNMLSLINKPSLTMQQNYSSKFTHKILTATEQGMCFPGKQNISWAILKQNKQKPQTPPNQQTPNNTTPKPPKEDQFRKLVWSTRAKSNPPLKTNQTKKDDDWGWGIQQRPLKYSVVHCLLQCAKPLTTGLGLAYLGKIQHFKSSYRSTGGAGI